MTDKPSTRKRSITPPLRSWPPQTKLTPLRVKHEKGLAGADDIVQWLALLMNKQQISYEELAERSGVPSRTIKKWFSAKAENRPMPSLQKMQACLEALGQSLVAVGASEQISDGESIYPIKRFRQSLLENWLEQTALHRGITVDELIQKLELEFDAEERDEKRGVRRREL
ncbi:helix-turn-helix transcriptional regulator [Ruegeria sp. HKCCD7318]|uniref:helix-turn-helix domain-containing protein n=1 Tax=Ruegeria sp. HKCCD7318 TaxID=2683014 RepID=UPI00147A9387|nr:helix-turn-helix domain-containing protein [Ruegeria sp. HKCCD7318]NOE32166.1 helix-turn-helix domain-containing protein [Ruegeria sp. HKCCD7318]